MEIVIEEGENLPPNAYLSVRLGDTRRQARYKKGEQLCFPSAKAGSFTLDVFEKVGTKQVGLLGLKELGAESRESVKIPKADGSEMRVDVKLSMAAQTGRKGASGKEIRHKEALKVKSYLDGHEVQSLLQMMMHSLFLEQPENPVAFMVKYLQGVSQPRAGGSPVTSPAKGAPPRTAEAPADVPKPRTSLTSSNPWYGEEGSPPQKSGGGEEEGLGGLGDEKPKAVAEPPKETAKVDYSSQLGLGAEEYPGFPTEKCPEQMPDLSRHHSVMADVLKSDPSIYDQLKGKRTSNGVSLAKCIKTGMDNKGHPMIKTVGMVAGDEESYEVFKELFDPVIDIRHNGYAKDRKHPTDMDVSKLSNTLVDPTGEYVISTRVRSGRSIRGLKLPPACSLEERREVERVLAKALLGLDGELKGDYYPLKGSASYLPKLGGMSLEEEERMRADHFLFQEPDSTLLLSSGMGRHWPDARGIFANAEKSFLVWCNEEDHARIISMQMGPYIREVFERLVRAANQIQTVVQREGYDYMHNGRLGYLTVCPSNLGTGLRTSMMMRLPNLGKRPELTQICEAMRLQARGASSGSTSDGIFDISNSERLGISEVDLMNSVIEGCARLVKMEEAIEKGASIDEFMNALFNQK